MNSYIFSKVKSKSLITIAIIMKGYPSNKTRTAPSNFEFFNIRPIKQIRLVHKNNKYNIKYVLFKFVLVKGCIS